MAVLKYKDPETGEVKKVGIPSIAPEDIGAATKEEVEELKTSVDGVTSNIQTQLNNIVSNDAKNAFGLGSSATPSDIFDFLGKYNQHWWRRRRYEKQVILLPTDMLCIYDESTSGDYRTTDYSDSYVADIEAGTVTLAEPISTTERWAQAYPENLEVVLGKYIEYDGAIYLVGSQYESIDRGYLYIEAQYVYVGYPDTEWEYVRSTDANAYPIGISNGYLYEYFGIPFNNAIAPVQCVQGSYIGTGTYGALSPNSLTFSFKPKLVIFTTSTLKTDSGHYPNGLFYNDLGGITVIDMEALTSDNYDGQYAPGRQDNAAKKSDDGRTLFWYSTDSAFSQWNSANWTFHYIAFG